MTAEPLMTVRDLRVSITRPGGRRLPIVRGVSFDVHRGRVLGVVGESGSGKSTVADAILGINPAGAHLTGEILFDGLNLVPLPERELRRIRGARIALVGQDPLESLNPVHRVGRQIAEVFAVHSLLPKRRAMGRAIELLGLCGLPDPETTARKYPHQLSGGMRQRVAIAIAMAAGPAIIVADEPTTALDNTVQRQVLRLLTSLCKDADVSLVFITHDLGVIQDIADDLIVMYAGSVLEAGRTTDLFSSPRHHYTQALLDARPTLTDGASSSLRSIPGVAPQADEVPTGCAFASRCGHETDRCGTWPELRPADRSDAHVVRCWHPRPGTPVVSPEEGG